MEFGPIKTLLILIEKSKKEIFRSSRLKFLSPHRTDVLFYWLKANNESNEFSQGVRIKIRKVK